MTEFQLAGDEPGVEDRWSALAAALSDVGADGLEPRMLELTPAAVLLLIYDKDGAPHIVFTKRTTRVATHKGEISLPGGAYEADKDATLLHTALREACEEVGIVGEEVVVLGRLPDVPTQASNYIIAPWVATAAARPRFQPDPIEVAEVLEVPLAVLRDPATLQAEDWELEDGVRRIDFYAHGDYKIWGATARILTEFLSILDRVDPLE